MEAQQAGSLAAQHSATGAWAGFHPEDGAASEAMHAWLCTSSTNLGVCPRSRLSLGRGRGGGHLQPAQRRTQHLHLLARGAGRLGQAAANNWVVANAEQSLE